MQLVRIDDRLSYIAILNIEQWQTDIIDVETIIDNFANRKSRKMNFLNLNCIDIIFN